jgi:hypothetical protein
METHHRSQLLRISCAAALAAALWLGPAAAPAAAETAFGLRAGTPGAGIELTTGLAPRLDLRLALAGWDQDLTVTTDDVRYDGTLELRHALALLDWHPAGGAFRLTAGVAVNDDALEATAPVADLLAGEVPELPPGVELGTLRGHAEGDQLAPYLGLGWGNPLGGDGGWSVGFDLGAIYLGSPDVSLELDTPLPIDTVPGLRELVDELLAQEEAELEQEIGDYDLLPVVSLSVGYRF